MDRHLIEALLESFTDDIADRIADKVAERLRVVERPRAIQGSTRSALPLRPLAKAVPRFVAPQEEEEVDEALPAEATGAEYLSTAEAAKLLGMTVKGLEGMRSKGTGPKFIRVGGRIRYRRGDLS